MHTCAGTCKEGRGGGGRGGVSYEASPAHRRPTGRLYSAQHTSSRLYSAQHNSSRLYSTGTGNKQHKRIHAVPPCSSWQSSQPRRPAYLCPRRRRLVKVGVRPVDQPRHDGAHAQPLLRAVGAPLPRLRPLHHDLRVAARLAQRGQRGQHSRHSSRRGVVGGRPRCWVEQALVTLGGGGLEEERGGRQGKAMETM